MIRTIALILMVGLAGCTSRAAETEAALNSNAAVAEIADLSVRVQMLEMDKTKLETKLAQLEGAINR